MGAFDIIVICLIAVAFVAAVGVIIYKKVTRKGGGCDCGCEGCPHACHCKSDGKKQNADKK
ncbi:MAG: FeoB-associated Cys-rich membrane protein [Clostridiales bacterium]|nr:FeoB-associated Cys-rich membrane protein [Clostridiales bacterium]